MTHVEEMKKNCPHKLQACQIKKDTFLYGITVEFLNEKKTKQNK